MKFDSLLSFSGGVDSTAALYQTLLSGRRVLCHVVDLRYPSGAGAVWARQQCEAPARANIVAWLSDNRLQNFDVKTSSWGWGAIPPSCDIYVTGFAAGMLLRHYRSIETFVSGTNADDATEANAHWPTRNAARINILLAAAGRSVKIEWPNIDRSKRDVYASMPAELAALCWYCRRPRADGEPCGGCPPCTMLKR